MYGPIYTGDSNMLTSSFGINLPWSWQTVRLRPQIKYSRFATWDKLKKRLHHTLKIYERQQGSQLFWKLHNATLTRETLECLSVSHDKGSAGEKDCWKFRKMTSNWQVPFCEHLSRWIYYDIQVTSSKITKQTGKVQWNSKKNCLWWQIGLTGSVVVFRLNSLV